MRYLAIRCVYTALASLPFAEVGLLYTHRFGLYTLPRVGYRIAAYVHVLLKVEIAVKHIQQKNYYSP